MPVTLMETAFERAGVNRADMEAYAAAERFKAA